MIKYAIGELAVEESFFQYNLTAATKFDMLKWAIDQSCDKFLGD